ncbi:MAG: arsenate reductase (glutaredoxin) [Polaribacter sp.]|jgi:arsenate reductase|nr:arsenate reductase (glutaredoxin) [Polaribacter sp.]
MIKIYHNPRCSKSRQGVELIENTGKAFEIIKYLDTKFTEATLIEVLHLLNIAPIDLVRKNEKIWKENLKGTPMSEDEIVSAMVNNPKLIERPIVVNKDKAIIGRPTSDILSII